MALKFKTKVGL